MTWNRHLAVFAAFNGAMAVAVGAFAAHGAGPQIKSLLTTGASYQLTHALLALICSILPGGRLAAIGGWLASLGGLIFCLALSILGHFILVVLLMRSGRMTPARSRLIHLSVLVQMLAILFLAKAMFLLSW